MKTRIIKVIIDNNKTKIGIRKTNDHKLLPMLAEYSKKFTCNSPSIIWPLLFQLTTPFVKTLKNIPNTTHALSKIADK